MSIKAPRNYSHPFWAHNFSICVWERPKPVIAMIYGFSDVSPSPKTNYVYLWRAQDTQDTSKIPRQMTESKFEISEIHLLEMSEHGR